jgi:stearoyl-CoA desaturase (delta-9 desaturase)
MLTLGEGSHNYHHAFPMDYRTSELPLLGFNWTTNVIEFFVWLELAYDLKTPSYAAIRDRVLRSGDGSVSFNLRRSEKS